MPASHFVQGTASATQRTVTIFTAIDVIPLTSNDRYVCSDHISKSSSIHGSYEEKYFSLTSKATRVST